MHTIALHFFLNFVCLFDCVGQEIPGFYEEEKLHVLLFSKHERVSLKCGYVISRLNA